MTTIMQDVLKALSAALNNEQVPLLNEDALREAEEQAIYALVCTKQQSLPYIAENVQLMWEQQELARVLDGIPYVALKGSSAAVYYPVPFRRMWGDIDILVSPPFFADAYRALVAAGYSTRETLEEDSRHIHFSRHGVMIELHRRFATLNTPSQERLLDEWLYAAEPVTGGFGQYSFPMLPDQLNGLVLLTHINQHLEEGIGLRHIADWAMYIRHSLSDNEWPSFQEKTDQLGLTTLAKAAARFGQKYLGVNPAINWCSDVNESTVEKLLEYVFECGNFGHKDIGNNYMIKVMSHGRTPRSFFRNLQDRGIENWKSAQKHRWLRPFAWIYQAGRYLGKGLENGGVRNLRKNIQASRRRNELLDELQATRLAFRKSQE